MRAFFVINENRLDALEFEHPSGYGFELSHLSHPLQNKKFIYAPLSFLGNASPQSNSMRGRFFRFPLSLPSSSLQQGVIGFVWIGILPTLQGKETHQHEVLTDHVGSSAGGKFPTRFPLGRLLTSFFGHGRSLPRHCSQMAQS
jgi:hypothetical protein